MPRSRFQRFALVTFLVLLAFVATNRLRAAWSPFGGHCDARMHHGPHAHHGPMPPPPAPPHPPAPPAPPPPPLAPAPPGTPAMAFAPDVAEHARRMAEHARRDAEWISREVEREIVSEFGAAR